MSADVTASFSLRFSLCTTFVGVKSLWNRDTFWRPPQTVSFQNVDRRTSRSVDSGLFYLLDIQSVVTQTGKASLWRLYDCCGGLLSLHLARRRRRESRKNPPIRVANIDSGELGNSESNGLLLREPPAGYQVNLGMVRNISVVLLQGLDEWSHSARDTIESTFQLHFMVVSKDDFDPSAYLDSALQVGGLASRTVGEHKTLVSC